MSTIINTPPVNSEDSGAGLVLGVILGIIIFGGLALFFIYGLPMIQNSQNQTPSETNINVTVPANTDTVPAK